MECGSIMMERGEWMSCMNEVYINESSFLGNSSSSFSDMLSCGDNDTVGSYYTNDTSTHSANLYSLGHHQDQSMYSESSDDHLAAYQSRENYDQFFNTNNNTNTLLLQPPAAVEFCLNTNGVVQVFPANNFIDDSETYLTQPDHSLDNEAVEEVKSNDDDSVDVGCKRSRNSEVQTGKGKMKAKRSRKLEKQNSNAGSCSSEEELSGKPRASRGSATDPQSLYARKRRERINERLRTLQKLVPNGTKVDLSTMLEEAVSYVKFLQLQIKLLSSDDLWMYAPLAYNGMDIGLDSKLNSLL